MYAIDDNKRDDDSCPMCGGVLHQVFVNIVGCADCGYFGEERGLMEMFEDMMTEKLFDVSKFEIKHCKTLDDIQNEIFTFSQN